VAATRQDRIVVARLAGTASRHARGRDLTRAEHDRAVAELVEIAAGRADLLAEWAGLAAGSSEDSPDEAVHLQAAQLCIDAGADKALIPGWIEVGRRRAAAARQQPKPLDRSPRQRDRLVDRSQ
jgi:NAD(P)-dependent dehydrogenase (short-subunit alcohol dehydrogenase family)